MPMKVTVCFDNVRVTVPCGEGTIPVRELISKAVHRYKRATAKGPNHWVEVASLKTISGGGILDPDDQLSDVVDDREQLIAEYEEQERPSIQHNGGDGASASSTGTTSPDIFHHGEGSNMSDHTAPPLPIFPPPRNNSSSSNNASTDVVITPRDLSLGSNLRVRRGSEPNLNLLIDEPQSDKNKIAVEPLRPLIPRRESVRDSDEPRSESSDEDKKVKVTMHGSLDRKKLGQNKFTRDALRTSLSSHPEMYRWFEAQEKQEQRSKQTKERMGPVEGHDGKDVNFPSLQDNDLICLQNDGGPLGIHAVPASDENGKDMGLLIQSIEPGRPVHNDGRIKPDDIIVEINGSSLYEVPFLRAQDIFRAAMDTKEIRLRVVKGSQRNAQESNQNHGKQTKAPHPPPVMPKPRNHAPIKPSPLTLGTHEPKSPIPAPRDISRRQAGASDSRVKRGDSFQGGAPVHSAVNSSATSPNTSSDSLPSSKRISAAVASANPVIKPGPPIKAPKKVPPALPARNPNTALSTHAPEAPLNAVTNTRRIGKKLIIKLKKGPLGLGFSVTSRDNQTDGNCPIYIRNILPKGAAVQDGQLRSGDRLLEVNGFKMTGKTQPEAVAFLRMLPEGSVVELVVSRQEEVDEKFKVPRKLGDPSQPAQERDGEDDNVDAGVDDAAVSPSQPSHSIDEVDGPDSAMGREKITLHIPLNESGSAGLGVSVKGKTESLETGMRDLGIFVKTVLQGGAACKDGRLQVNDQLLEVNGVKLEGMSNFSAMEALRLAMMEDGHIRGHITLTIARRSGSASSPFLFGDSPDNSQMDIIPPVAHNRSVSSPDVSPIVHQRSSSASDASSPRVQRYESDIDMPSPIPPVRTKRVSALRERFSESGNGLRNESYTKATHDSLNDSSGFAHIMPTPQKLSQAITEPLHQDGKENRGMNDNDTYTLPNKPQRPHSTIGFMRGPRNSHSSASDDEAYVRASVSSSKEESDLSPNGEVIPFAREGFGRQSMSEKRKGHLDPRSTEIYKLVKANKENKGGFLGRRVRSFHVTGGTNADMQAAGAPPSTGPPLTPRQPSESNLPMSKGGPSNNSMAHVSSNRTYQPNRVAADILVSNPKRSSSVEDLSTLPPDAPASVSSSSSQQNRDASPLWRAGRFGRSRACNDSFRAAVDRSYDALDPALMDTLEEESAESGAFTLDPSHSGRSSISSEATNEDTNSLKRRKAKEKEKKGGLLKGFLRFGKGRKSNEEAMRRSRSEERSGERIAERRLDYSSERPSKDIWGAKPIGDVQDIGFIPVSEPSRQQRGRRGSQQEQERIEEEYARLRDHHVTEQRLRSQSVDPSVGRNTLNSSSSQERSSPFQPYAASFNQQHPLQHHMDHQQTDPRHFHPAGVAPQGFRENQKYFPGAEMDEDVKSNVARAVLTRAEYIQQLRTLYQHRHRQRQGVYPLDDTEERYEKQIQEMEQRWDQVPDNSYDGRMRDPNILCFTDRPPSRSTNQPTFERPYGSSSSMSNMSNNSLSFYTASHHHLQYAQNNTASQSHPGSRPHSRNGPGGFESNSVYIHHQQQNAFHQYQPQRQHHHQNRVHDDFANPNFQDHYNSSNNVDNHEGRLQYQLYTSPPQAYRNAPHQYAQRKGNPPYPDPSSAKV